MKHEPTGIEDRQAYALCDQWNETYIPTASVSLKGGEQSITTSRAYVDVADRAIPVVHVLGHREPVPLTDVTAVAGEAFDLADYAALAASLA
jgi:hypothetical protein